MGLTVFRTGTGCEHRIACAGQYEDPGILGRAQKPKPGSLGSFTGKRQSFSDNSEKDFLGISSTFSGGIGAFSNSGFDFAFRFRYLLNDVRTGFC